MEDRNKKPVPPYVAYKTLNNFVDRFRQGLPARIDRGLMGSMSGAAQSQVTTALRYLGMISDSGHPTPVMRRYATGEEQERRAALKEALEKGYPFLFDGIFSFENATSPLLREAFETHTSATGETVSRCIAFLKDAAADAGIKVSPFITQKKARAANGRKREKIKKEERPAGRPQADAPAHVPDSFATPAQSSLLLSGLFLRLPKPGTTWPKEDRERWLQTLQNVLLLEYPENQM